tara:strand:+ start:864 stop:1190 length:327 start_codon:yes stop_codon:yes gene_type:complete
VTLSTITETNYKLVRAVIKDRKPKCEGKWELDTRRIVQLFGGITQCARSLRASGNDVSEGAVDVWRRRGAMNTTSLLHLLMIAHQTGMKFNLLDYVKPKEQIVEGDKE